jgi:hypothetical protein
LSTFGRSLLYATVSGPKVMIARESLDEEWGIRLDDFVRTGLRPSGVIDSLAPRMTAFELDVSCHDERGSRVESSRNGADLDVFEAGEVVR